VPFAANLAASDKRHRAAVPRRRTPRSDVHLDRGGVVDTLEVSYEGQIADYDCRVLTLSVLKGVLAPVVDEPVSFVNAPQMAEERGLNVRETTSSSARDYVNLIELRGTAKDRTFQVAGTLYGTQNAAHRVDRRLHRRLLRRRTTCSWSATSTSPACRPVRHDQWAPVEHRGADRKGPTGTPSSCCRQRVGAAEVVRTAANDGIVDAQAIELD
jgi:D-3-phosphoglycerate dehydrogenase